MNKYINGKIYEIFDKDDLEAPRYYGSTCKTLDERMGVHEKNINVLLVGKLVM